MTLAYLHLTAWHSFSDIVDSHKWSWSGTANATLSRANARFRAASNMAVTFNGYKTEATANGHADVLKAAMAYSALDALLVGISDHCREFQSTPPAEFTMISPSIAEMYRDPQSSKFRETMQALTTNKKIKCALDDLANGRTDDASMLARGVRHLAFHGLFTPATVGYSRAGGGSRSAEVLKALRSETLLSTDAYFSAWTDALEVPPLSIAAP